MRIRRQIPFAFFLLLVSSCGLLQPAAPSASPSQPSVASATGELRSPSPEITPSPVPPTDTPPPASLNPQGPYVAYSGEDGIWISNPDGSFLTRISELGILAPGQDLHDAISPRGDRIATAVVHPMGVDLFIVNLPDGQRENLTRLVDITPDELAANSLSLKAFAYYAVTQYKDLAWRPGDGAQLAFTGAQNGETTDLYLYAAASHEIRQLTDGPSEAIHPDWSPDGGYILHFGVRWLPPFGGALVGFNRMDGFWAVRASDGKVIEQPKPEGTSLSLIGWRDSSHYLIYDQDDQCAFKNLRSVDAAAGTSDPVLDFCFYTRPGFSPENGAMLFSGDAACACSPGEGVFLLPPGGKTLQKLLDKKVFQIDWLPESGVFQAYPEALFSADGSRRYDPPVYEASYEPAISKRGIEAWEVIENRKGRVVVRAPGGDWQTILEGSVADLVWDPVAGDTLLIVLDNGSLYSASAPDFTAREMGSFGGRINQTAWIP